MKKIIVPVLFLLCASLTHADFVVGSFDGSRSSRPFSAENFDNIRALLTNPGNFGPGGTVGTAISFAPAISTATAGTLAGLDMLIISEVTGLTGDELNAIRTFILNGGHVILQYDSSGAESGSQLLALLDGGSIGGMGGNQGADAASLLVGLIGPFGTWPIGSTFANSLASVLTPGSATTLVGQSGGANIVGVIPADALGVGSGSVLILTDVLMMDYFIDPPTLWGNELNTDLILNFFGNAVGSSPTPVTLGSMTAQRSEDGVLVSWETVMEFENLGFNLYRSTSPDGERTLVNADLIAGTGTSDGRSYTFLDSAAPEGPVFYWLEDVAWNFDSELHGQVAVLETASEDGERLSGLTIGPEEGVYRVSYETLKAEGLPVDLMNPGDLKLNVDGEEAALFVSAWKGPMQAGDYVLFYAAAGEGERAVSVQSGVEAHRMEYAYAGPVEEGDVWVGEAGEGLLAFETQAEVSRYFVMGLPDNQALVLDVTDAAQPILLYGYAWVNQAQGDALYMSYGTEQPAKLLAVAESAIRDVAAP